MPSTSLTDTFASSSAGLEAATKLNSGAQMPWLGLGVWQVHGDSETERVVRAAIDVGYRSVDTATIYGNEAGVGRAVRDCGVRRDQLFVTTKVWNDDVRAGRISTAFEHSLKRLGLDYVDLYLVHWPITGKIATTWRAMEKLLESGRVKSVGVSNHLRPHLDEILSIAKVVPAVNQVEYHPYLQSTALIDFCHAKEIRPVAWSPLMKAGALLQDRVLGEIAKRHNKTAAQIVLRWHVQSGVVAIPKTTHVARMRENAGIFDFSLSDAEMAAIKGLDREQRTGPDPANIGF